MSKPAAIILLVVLALLLVGLFKILLPSIRKYISRMPKGIFVLLFLAVAVTVVYLVHYLITDATGGVPGNVGEDSQAEVSSENNDIPKTDKENCVVLFGSDIYVENAKAEIAELENYLDYRVNNNIPVTIVDDYATLALFNNVKAICDKKGVRYSIENEEWLK